jgi:hypothetical protein
MTLAARDLLPHRDPAGRAQRPLWGGLDALRVDDRSSRGFSGAWQSGEWRHSASHGCAQTKLTPHGRPPRRLGEIIDSIRAYLASKELGRACLKRSGRAAFWLAQLSLGSIPKERPSRLNKRARSFASR